jgi:hypothetical protein
MRELTLRYIISMCVIIIMSPPIQLIYANKKMLVGFEKCVERIVYKWGGGELST